MTGPFPDGWYVVPKRFVKVPGHLGDNGSWESAGELPRALFAPSAGDEPVKLSDAVEGDARLYWHGQSVELDADDQVEVPSVFEGGRSTRWSLVGFPQEWPMGTVALLERA